MPLGLSGATRLTGGILTGGIVYLSLEGGGILTGGIVNAHQLLILSTMMIFALKFGILTIMTI